MIKKPKNITDESMQEVGMQIDEFTKMINEKYEAKAHSSNMKRDELARALARTMDPEEEDDDV